MMRLCAYLNYMKRKLRKGGKCFLDVRLITAKLIFGNDITKYFQE